MVRVKLCGMMSEADVAMAEEAGADAVGFVTEYPVPVPWNLTREEAARLVRAASPFVTTVAVVGGTVDEILDIARKVMPNVLQLHGDESLAEILAIIDGLADTGIRVIKALRIDVDTGLARFEKTDPVRAAKALEGSGIAALIVDSKTASMPAGTGVALDQDVAARVSEAVKIPLILAGGLTAVNVAEAVLKVRPYAVDVITGVEREPGVKDKKKMEEFVKAAKGLDAER
ncbi:MAG: phosphoribosylanthranilate isomerase [bacterium]|nr:MAG: phosphoribosylanthranilate isomerase [bacterium]